MIRRTIAAGVGVLLAAAAQGQSQIEQWTEADGVLGLGYPVPIPVNTDLPFDGFRSYAGLHLRHQDLAATSDRVQGFVVGQTEAGRDIWAYRVGDADLVTRDGRPEAAMLLNGGIHAREWQTPEVVTAVMERLVDNAGDAGFHDFLLDNLNVVILPVMNVDAFLQTQRFPRSNYLGTDPFDLPDDPAPAPRDGRMRRKNMPGVDEVLETEGDHLLGVDLNRNSPPFWATNPNRSSPDVRSLVHHGASPHSEPESQALLTAAGLGPTERLRAFTDVHSFSQVFYFDNTGNTRLTQIVAGALTTLSNFNTARGGTLYLFNPNPANVGVGVGFTDEYFSNVLQIPAWGVEVEPTQGQSFFPNNPPGCGADYGGLARNCHDGFILPESEIRRVREEMSSSFTAVYYQLAGPPAVAAARWLDPATKAVVFEAEWDPVDDASRVLHVNALQPIELDREYTLWLAFDRPMRWRNASGAVTAMPGQPTSTLNLSLGAIVDGNFQVLDSSAHQWRQETLEAPEGYFRYRDDALSFPVRISSNGQGPAPGETAEAVLTQLLTNMTNQRLDADPATAADFANGAWVGYEDSGGVEGDFGGTDQTLPFTVTADSQPAPFLIEPGTSAAWFDPSHNGEGFIIEILPEDRVVLYWFTYDDQGEQAWFIATGEVRGNRLLFPELIQATGGVFGPDFDPDVVQRTAAGSARFVYENCDTGSMVYEIGNRKGRLNLQRLSRVMGADCGGFVGGPVQEEAIESGSWFNTEQSGHGFTIEVLAGGQVLVYWFHFDLEGNPAWFFGTGAVVDGQLVLDEVFQTRGPAFGPDFDPTDFELIPWGTLRFDLGCGTGTVDYDGALAGFGTGTLELTRLSTLDGLGCNG